ncbi:MAG: polymer-forming cytoskeletal protein [Clostridiales bacterium]|nr:polymer-forming cytoskeletal protein [Clostridiales bacterium]
MINLKDLLRSGRPEEGTPQTEDVSVENVPPEGERLVPDFTVAGDYIEDVHEEIAEHAYAPSEAYTPPYEPEPEPEAEEPVRAVTQPAWQGDQSDAPYVEESEEEIPMGVSLISREATVLGDIITEGHIDVVGKVRGNVEAEGNVAVRGLVSGDVSGEKIGLYHCRVKGDLNAGTGVVIDSDSVVIGDVDTDNVVLGGKLKGDIKATRMAVLRSDAYFIGDVETESIAVESGAVVNGNIRTLIQGDLEAPFDD